MVDEASGGIAEFEEWLTTAEVARLLDYSHSWVFTGVRDGTMFPGGDVRKKKYGQKWSYLVRKSAVNRRKIVRDRELLEKKQIDQKKERAAAAQAWRVRVRSWLRADGVRLPTTRRIPEEHIQAYEKAHPDDLRPPDHDVVIRDQTVAARRK